MKILTQELFFGLVGGLGFFLLGLSLMGQGFQRIAGHKIRRFLESTENLFVAVLAGLLLTVVLQDGGAAMILVLGLLGSGLLRFKQAVSIMFGINLGITLIVQVIAFRLDNYPLLAVGLGFLLYSFAKRRITRYLGQTILGFGLVFTGLNIFTSVMEPLAGNIMVQGAIARVADVPWAGYLFGAFTSSLVQSNTAAIGLLQTFARQPIIVEGMRTALLPLSTTLPFVFGTNLGVCTTAALVSLKCGAQAKRAVLAQYLFNLATFGLVLLVLAPFTNLVHWLTNLFWSFGVFLRELVFLLPPGFFPQEAEVISRQIAIGHTLFNLLLVLLWLPLLNLVHQLTRRFFNDQENKGKEINQRFLNYDMLHTPSVALRLASKEILGMAELTLEMLNLAQTAFVKGHALSAREVEKKEELVDDFQEKITLYLSTLLSRSLLNPAESQYLTGLMHMVNDVERIADHANNIAEAADAKIDEKLPFSELAVNELALLYGKVTAICKKAFTALAEEDSFLAKQVLEREEVIDKLQEEMRQNHINRLNQGKCWPGSGIIYVEIIANLERVADHATNIAQMVLKAKEVI